MSKSSRYPSRSKDSKRSNQKESYPLTDSNSPVRATMKHRPSLCGWRPGLTLLRKSSLQPSDAVVDSPLQESFARSGSNSRDCPHSSSLAAQSHSSSPRHLPLLLSSSSGKSGNVINSIERTTSAPAAATSSSTTTTATASSHNSISLSNTLRMSCDSVPIATEATDIDTESHALREAFDFFDRDRDGRITCAELHSVFHMLGRTATRQEIKNMISQVDADCNGTVEYPEFLKMMRNYSYQHTNCEEAELLDAFSVFDHNGDNYIDFEEIKSTMHALGEKVSDADVRAMIKEADSDNDGKINFDEFKRMMALLRADRQPVHRE